MKNNFHTHTYRCGHATGTDEAYVLSAIAADMDTLGFSDHTPWPYRGEYKPQVRMDISQFEGYVYRILSLKDRFKGKIDIRLGLECEYYAEFMPWLTDTAREKELYLIFGCHFPTSALDAEYFGHSVKDREHLDYYLETVLRGMEYERFLYLAHPDLFMRAYPSFDGDCERISRKICEKAARLRIPLEFNIGGYQIGQDRGKAECYPHDAFWKIAADCGCACIIGYDAHRPQALERDEDWACALKTIRALGLKRIESIDEIAPRWK